MMILSVVEISDEDLDVAYVKDLELINVDS